MAKRVLFIGTVLLFTACVMTPVTQVNKPPPIEHIVTVDVHGHHEVMEMLEKIQQRLDEIEAILSLEACPED